MGVDHDQGVGPCRGMNRLGRKHDDKRQHKRKQVNPCGIPKSLETEDADEGATEMATQQCAWLDRRRTSKSEEEDSRSSQ